MNVKPKKHLGQHFLVDKNIAHKIVDSLLLQNIESVLEIGPGKGILSEIIIQKHNHELYVVDIDEESIEYLKNTLDIQKENIIHADFLKDDIIKKLPKQVAVIGNLPYNISSQIMFKILENKDNISEVVCMIQKEVAERFVAKSNSKTYGILSVLLQAFYNLEYLFSVSEKVFYPRPKVQSAVVRLIRKPNYKLDCPEDLFFRIVKAGFGQRRKTLRNSLKVIIEKRQMQNPILQKRAEQLSVDDFVELTNLISDSSIL